MRSFVLITVGALALVLAGASRPAVTTTKTVKITATAFSPASVTIKTGDAIIHRIHLRVLQHIKVLSEQTPV